MITTESKEQYLAAYKQATSHGSKRLPAWLGELREAGIASFDALGFPTLKNEDWKYTNLEPIAAQSFARANGEAKGVSAREIVARSMIDSRRHDLRRDSGRHGVIDTVSPSRASLASSCASSLVLRRRYLP